MAELSTSLFFLLCMIFGHIGMFGLSKPTRNSVAGAWLFSVFAAFGFHMWKTRGIDGLMPPEHGLVDSVGNEIGYSIVQELITQGYWLTVAVAACAVLLGMVLALLVSLGLTIRREVTAMIQEVLLAERAEMASQEEDSLEGLWVRDKLSDLKELCLKELEEKPNDLGTLWYLARAHQKLGENDRARFRFAEIVALNPGMADEVQAYLPPKNNGPGLS